MKIKLILAILSLFLGWQCVLPSKARIDSSILEDDRRLVSRKEFLHESSWTPLKQLVGFKTQENLVILECADGKSVFFTFLSPEVFRFWFSADPARQPFSTVVRQEKLAPFELSIEEEEKKIVLKTSLITINIDKITLQWIIYRNSTLLAKTDSPLSWFRHRAMQEWDFSSSPHIWGLGSSGKGWDKKGQSVKFWNDLEGNNDETSPYSAPFIMGSTKGGFFGLLLDNSYQTYISLEKNRSYVGVLNGGLNLYFIAGKDAKAVITSVSDLLGKPAWGPSWALNTQTEETSLSEPLSALPIALGLSVQRWVLPHPSEDLAIAGQEKGFFTSQIPDYTQIQTRQWWASAVLDNISHQSYAWSLGAILPSVEWNTRFWNEGKKSPKAQFHNLYPILAAQACYEAQSLALPGHRPWVTLQSGFLGLSSYGTLEIPIKAGIDDETQLDKILSVGLGGPGWVQVNLDVSQLDREKAWRSLALWALNPYLKLSIKQEAQMWWNNLTAEDQKRFKNLLKLHTSLKPLFYEITRQASLTGLPALRPLFVEFPQDSQAVATKTQFMLGKDVMVAPVFHEAPLHRVYLPLPGPWFNWYSGQEVPAGQEIDVPVKENRIPLFVKAGGIVPVNEFQELKKNDPCVLTVHIFPARDSQFTLYNDDELTYDYRQGAYQETSVLYTSQHKTMTLDHQVVHSAHSPRQPSSLLYRVHNVHRPHAIKINGRNIPLYGDSYGVTDTDRSSAWYEKDHTLLIKVFKPHTSQTIDMFF